MKVSILQTKLIWEDIEANFSSIEEQLSKVPADTEIVVLPEMFTTGFSMKPEEFAERYPGKTVEWMQRMAKLKGAAITGSYIANVDGKYFNRMIFALPNGQIHVYDKRHLFRMAEEDKHYSAGDKRVVVTYKGWRILLQVCYDLRFPVWMRNRNDYDLIILVANFPERRRYVWNSLLVARAIENQCYVAACNRVGVDGNGYNHTGDSQVIDAKGTVVALATPNSNQIVTADLSMEALQSFRNDFPVHLDADDFELKL